MANSTASLEINLRPIRTGYLVNPGDRQVISEVARIASCQWGGIACPMIPVMEALPPAWCAAGRRNPEPNELTRGMLRYFEPDLLVETCKGQLNRVDPNVGNRYERHPNLNHGVFEQLNGAANTLRNVGVTMDHVYAFLHRKEFQFERRTPRTLLRFEAGDEIGQAFFEAAYGMFPNRPDFAGVEEEYERVFDARSVPPDVESWMVMERQEAMCPFDVTLHGTQRFFERSWEETIFVFDPLSGPDIVDFWNIRLFRRGVVPVNVHWLAGSRNLIVDLIRRKHRPLPNNAYGVMIHTTIQLGRSLDPAVIEVLRLSEAELPVGSYAIKTWYDPIWQLDEPDLVMRPRPSPLSAERREVEIPLDDRWAARVPHIAPTYLRQTRGDGPGWVNTISPKFYGFNNDRADAMPSAAVDRNRDYPPSSELMDQRPTREGWLSLHSYDQDGQSIRLPFMRNVVTPWLAGQGILAAPSDAGRVADSMLASLGGLNRCRVFGHEEVLRQFDRMAHSRREIGVGEVEEIPFRTATVDQLQPMLRAIGTRWGRPATLQSFVDVGALRLGLSVQCDHCRKWNWYDLDEVATKVTCERCLSVFPFPQGQLPPRTAWRYRVVGPYAVPNLAGGAYTCLLTLNFLREAFGISPAMTFTTALDLTRDGEKLETDIFVWHDRDLGGRRLAGPNLLVGECKGFAEDAFKQADVDRLRRLGEWLPGTYLLAACLKSVLSDGEKKRLADLCRWGWARPRTDGKSPSPVIVITGADLFDPDGMERNLGRMPDPGNTAKTGPWSLLEFAAATQKGYLQLSDEAMIEMRYG